MWRGCYDIHWAICHGALIIEVTRDGVNYISQPFGGIDEDLPKILATLREYFQGSSFQMIAILEEGKARLEKFLPEITEYQDDRDNWDYVYLQEKLASLSGRKYHGKKNHANAFRKEYPDYVYEQITEDNLAECYAFFDKWCERRQAEDSSIGCEFCAIKEALGNRKVLGIQGGLIRIGGQIEACTFGEKLNEDTALIHVEKANPDIRGLYTVINQDFVNNAWSEVKYINREEDMGKDGLRKAKESYNPEFMVKKYLAVIK